MEKVNEKKMNNTTTTASMSVQVTPTKPETVSFGTSMEDLDQFRKDVELVERETFLKEQLEQQALMKKEQEKHLELYQLEMEKKIRDMTEKFAAQIADAARLSGDDESDFNNYSGTDLDTN